MPIRQKIFAMIVAIALFIYIIDLVRRKKLRIEYSYLWMITGIVIMIVAVWHDFLLWISRLIGAVWPTSTLFLLALIFLTAICIHFSVRLSLLSDQVQILSQEIALLKTADPSPAPPGKT
ncbi:MAG: DUF2304 domain-containing protein [Proteobacteria bacterium]|nr:DUF2304 domain-containing protein [Pseudomonadota bacterium]